MQFRHRFSAPLVGAHVGLPVWPALGETRADQQDGMLWYFAMPRLPVLQIGHGHLVVPVVLRLFAHIDQNRRAHEMVQGNLVGTDVTGVSPLGNGSTSVLLDKSAAGNTIGGGNVIAYNGQPGTRGGVLVTDGATRNAIVANSIFSNTEGRPDVRGLEFGDSDTRNTFQLKAGPVLQPTGRGIFNRPSLRFLYGMQYSSQNNAFGNAFVDTIDQYNDFQPVEQRIHHLVAAEAEVWF